MSIMPKIAYLVLISLVIAIFTGCGTIANNKTGVKKIVSTPTGANFTVFDKYNVPAEDSLKTIISGVTPQSIRWKSNYDYVKFDMRGYPSQTIRPRKAETNYAVWGNIGLICTGAIMVPAVLGRGDDDVPFSIAMGIGTFGVVGLIIDLVNEGYRKYPDNIIANMEMPATQTPQPQNTPPENNSISSLQDIEEALTEAIQLAFKEIPPSSRIAVLSIYTSDNTHRDYVLNETEVRLFNQGFRLVDRTHLETIRSEQGLQYSGEVDDVTSVNIGKLAGARYIVTGSVDGTGMLRRLRLKVLDTETAEVVGLASVRF